LFGAGFGNLLAAGHDKSVNGLFGSAPLIGDLPGLDLP
jgi:hypothetical protein